MFGTYFAPEDWADMQLIGFYFLQVFLPSLDQFHYFLALIGTCNNSLFMVICNCVAIYIAFHTVNRNPDLTVVREKFSVDFNRPGISPIQCYWPPFHTTQELLYNLLYLSF